MFRRRCIECRLQFGGHRNFECRASLTLAHAQDIIADMLAPHMDHVTTPLGRAKKEFESEPCAGAVRMTLAEDDNIFFAPCSEAIAFDHLPKLDTFTWVICTHADQNCEAHQAANSLKPILFGVRPIEFRENLVDMFALQQR